LSEKLFLSGFLAKFKRILSEVTSTCNTS